MRRTLCGILLCFFGGCSGENYVLSKRADKHSVLDWHKLGLTPNAAMRYTPQGMAIIDDQTLLLAESWLDKKTVIYEFKLQGEGYRVARQFVMPEDAVHTSGLSVDADGLWAVDYASHNLYLIDLSRSFDTGHAVLKRKIKTGLYGAGSVTTLMFRNIKSLAVTDFMNSGKTYIVPISDCIERLSLVQCASASYTNAFYNQGIKFDGKYIWESHNLLGVDVVYIIGVQKSVKGGSYKDGLVASFDAPGRMVEDIAISGDKVFTSDEESFEVFVANKPKFF